MKINDVIIHFSDILISTSGILFVLSLIYIMYYIPIIFGIKWAKAKGINPNIMWLMWFFYSGILALIIMRYMWIKELIMKNSFFKVYYIDKEAYSHIKNNFKNIFHIKTIIIGMVSIMIFSIFFVSTGFYNSIRGTYLLKNNQEYKAKKYFINSVNKTTFSFSEKVKNYHKTMTLCEAIEDISCMNYISKIMYKEDKTTARANLYLAIYNADINNFKTALEYLEPVKYLYDTEYKTIENAYYEYKYNTNLKIKEDNLEDESNDIKNSQYTLLNMSKELITDTIDSLSDFDLSGTDEEIAEKVFLKMTAQGRIVGRIKTVVKLWDKLINYKKYKRIKQLVIKKKLKALANKKDYRYSNKIYNYKKSKQLKSKNKLKNYRECLNDGNSNCYKILEN
jgi:hypothetical protein